MTFRNQAETLIADSKHPHNTIGATPLASYAHTTVTLNTSGIITKPVMPTITQSDNKTDDEDDNMDTNDKGDGRNNTTPPGANNIGEPSTPPDRQGHPDGHDGEVDRALPQADTTAGGNGSANTDKPQATTFGSGQYSGRTQRPNRNCKTSHANKSYGFIHLNVNTGYNTSLAAGYTKQIRPTHMTFPIRHRVFQEIIENHVNFHTIAPHRQHGKPSIVSVKENGIMSKAQWATVTHYIVAQYKHKTALKCFSEIAE